MKQQHVSVLANEVIEHLKPGKGEKWIDGTFGGGGHAKSIIKAIQDTGWFMGIDADPEVIAKNKETDFFNKKNVVLQLGNFREMKQFVLEQNLLGQIDGILLDLGYSSIQMDNLERGFSFNSEEKLDMRFNPEEGESAADVVNTYGAKQLAKIFKEYGEEKNAFRIAKAIVASREEEPIESGKALAEIVARVNGHDYSKKNPATRVFQALRIYVNDELNSLKQILEDSKEILAPGGRIGIISFHSLEDRIIKQFFNYWSKDCICPPEFPICQCTHKKIFEVQTRKPIAPTEEEIQNNARSRSAKLRIAKKI